MLDVHSLVIEAQEYFKEKEIDIGVRLLEKAHKDMKEKLLYKTRKKTLAGYYSEIKKIKREIEEKDPGLKKNKNTKFLSMSVPWNEYSSYKIAKNVFYRFSELINI